MSDTLRSAAQQALETLEEHGLPYLHHEHQYSKAITALRAALAAAVATEREMASEIERLVRERDEPRKKLIPLLELARKAGHGIGDKK